MWCNAKKQFNPFNIFQMIIAAEAMEHLKSIEQIHYAFIYFSVMWALVEFLS